MRTPFFNPPSVSSSGGSSVTIATTWGSPTSDEEVPSEKLAKDTLDSKQVAGESVTVGAGKTLDVSAGTLKITSQADTTLSGAPKVFTLWDSSGNPYYFKAYPIKA